MQKGTETVVFWSTPKDIFRLCGGIGHLLLGGLLQQHLDSRQEEAEQTAGQCISTGYGGMRHVDDG